MIREVKMGAKFFAQQVEKSFMVLLANQPIREHTEALVHPKSRHSTLCVMEVFVCPQKTLKYLN